MGIFADYKDYKVYNPEYKPWKDKRNLDEAKRLEYLKQNPNAQNSQKEDVQRAEALLNAIDIMDEYSQSKAENMEIVTDQMVQTATQIAQFGGSIVGGILCFIPPIAKTIDHIAFKINPKIDKGLSRIAVCLGTGVIASLATAMGLQGWAAAKQVSASRNGRFEAMQNELQDVKKFATLTDDQEKLQNELAQKIPTTKAMLKGNIAQNSNMLNPLTSFRLIGEIINPNQDIEEERIAFNEELNTIPQNAPKLTEADILKAKKDQQLLLNIAEKIDMASQDYSENTELVVGTLTALALSGGFLTGFITNKLIKGFKIVNKNAVKYLPKAIGGTVALSSILLGTYLQKQASRVGRFKAKQELEKNPNNFIYVSQESIDNLKNDVQVPQKERPNLFSFCIQAIKDNLEYNKYLKTKGIEEKKKMLALKDIELTPEQIKNAKQLQKNTFKVFNKLDEKSQRYAESVEAVGATILQPIALVSSLAGMGIGALVAKAKNIKISSKHGYIPLLAGSLLGAIPPILVNMYFTKEEKQASRVAHMLAINEMSDYKKFVDYENLEITKPNSQNKVL